VPRTPTRARTCACSGLQQQAPLLRCGRVLQLACCRQRPAGHKLLPRLAKLLLLLLLLRLLPLLRRLLQQQRQVPLDDLVQQLAQRVSGHLLAGNSLHAGWQGRRAAEQQPQPTRSHGVIRAPTP
jgi:hypothetical protein